MSESSEKKNYKDMMLLSGHGYMMPFILVSPDTLQVTLDYGEQNHPMTGGKFIHKGTDLVCKGKDLYAVADGLVTGAGNDAVHDNYIVVKHGKWEVTYGHISEAYTPYGTNVLAGDVIAKSGDFLHLGVRFDGKDLDPMTFLGMLYQNVQLCAAAKLHELPSTDDLDGKEPHTPYDKDKDELMFMFAHWLPSYLNELNNGSYAPSSRIENSLRNVFAQSADKNYFYETLPSAVNPLGLTSRAVPLVEKIQGIIIGDFLNYMALRHGKYLSTWNESQKKNFLLSQGAVA